ncbi:hypothetical protein [Streptomyces boluensis]|uniref:Secreted protein n=1 Tax=Streptomyces boluensis TaxID=1775135 RepID=A0A964UW19_9ACTN|nr:hypothetical protein [Streptomyces boluensis]NBE56441.1 hypothetical protein [Streptomyces boluensis]
MSGSRYVSRMPRVLLVLVALLAAALLAGAPAPALAAPAYAVTGEPCPEVHDTDNAARTVQSRRPAERRPAPALAPTRCAPHNTRTPRQRYPWPSSTSSPRTEVLRC